MNEDDTVNIALQRVGRDPIEDVVKIPDQQDCAENTKSVDGFFTHNGSTSLYHQNKVNQVNRERCKYSIEGDQQPDIAQYRIAVQQPGGHLHRADQQRDQQGIE